MKLKKIQGVRGEVKISLVKNFFFQEDGRKGMKTGNVQYGSGLPYLVFNADSFIVLFKFQSHYEL
jgi:hypothetical protein